MEEAGEARGGFLSSIGRLLRTAVAYGHNRIELLLVELQEERWRFFNILLLTGLVFILAGMTLLVVTVTIVVVCMRANRIDVVIALALVYLAATIASFWRLLYRLKHWTPFSATLDELKKDKECLEEKS
jgi:uncharacterized membrane protein YqjE